MAAQSAVASALVSAGKAEGSADLAQNGANQAKSVAEFSSNVATEARDKLAHYELPELLTESHVKNLNHPNLLISFNNNTWIELSSNLQVPSRIQAELIATNKMVYPCNGDITFDGASLRSKFTKYSPVYLMSNQSSYLQQYEDTLEFKTHVSQAAYGGVAPHVIQTSIDAGGSLYVRSNIHMPAAAVIRAT